MSGKYFLPGFFKKDFQSFSFLLLVESERDMLRAVEWIDEEKKCGEEVQRRKKKAVSTMRGVKKERRKILRGKIRKEKKKSYGTASEKPPGRRLNLKTFEK